MTCPPPLSSTAGSDRSGRTLESTNSVLHLKAVLQMAPQLAAALSRNGTQPPEDELLLQMHGCLASPELEALERTIGQVIEEDAVNQSRLLLVRAAQLVIKKANELLGIGYVDKV